MATINLFGNKASPVVSDILHLWSTADAVDMNINLEQLRDLLVGDLADLDTDTQAGIVVAINELVSRVTWPKNAGFHNGIFRGKYLGTSVTAEQYAQIAAGTFDDLYIGDYWVINGVTWRIAAFDYWYNTGDQNCTTHHIVIVPDSNLLAADGSTTHWMHSSNTTSGAYVGTDFYAGTNGNTGKAQCLTLAQNAFGSAHILTHREYLQNAAANGFATAGAWYDSDVEIMNEQMVYGCKVFGDAINGTTFAAQHTIDTSQLPLFALAPQYIANRANWWLRDVASTTNFAYVAAYGTASAPNASYAWAGVRPAFGIKAA